MFLPAYDFSLTYSPFLSAFSDLGSYIFVFVSFLLANLSTLDLIKRCSKASQDWEEIWQEFENRFGKLILFYLLKEFRRYSKSTNGIQLTETIKDLRQDVYIKLLKNEGKALKAFKGTNENSFLAYLYTISKNVVINYLKKNQKKKKWILGRGVDAGIENNEIEPLSFETSESIELAFLQESILQILQKHYRSRNSKRDILIFELFYFQGMSANDIKNSYNVNLSVSGIETVANRVKQSLQEKFF